MVLTFMKEKTGFNKTANKNPISTRHLISKKKKKQNKKIKFWCWHEISLT